MVLACLSCWIFVALLPAAVSSSLLPVLSRRVLTVALFTTTRTQILAHSFRLDIAEVTFKIRNSRGFLIPLNSCIPVNSKQMPYVLEVAKYFQHVNARPRSIAMTVIHRSLKSRLQGIVRRIERLEELLPQIKQKQHDKMTKDIDLLNQKLIFLHKRMQMAESCYWEGMFRRAPLW
ncbi:hypothetical protein MHYP_G00041170 [Metynnis hypsauchen]